MASSNACHMRNGVRGSGVGRLRFGVGCLFKWVVVRRPIERKPTEVWASQGDGGFRKE